MAFLREAEDILARLPSISLDGMDPLFPSGDPALAKSHYAGVPTKANLAAQKCTITTGPQPFPPFDPSVPGKTGIAKSSATLYSTNSTLYPLSSLESYSGAEGDRLPIGDERDELQARNASVQTSGSDVAEEWGLRRSPRNSGSQKSKGLREKRKVGRPIAYCGDPDSPDLTPAERRRIKRRIANRESARRVRARRQDLIEEMAVKADKMEKHNSNLATHATAVEEQHMAMMAQMKEYSGRLHATSAQNEALQREIAHMRSLLEKKSEAAVPVEDHSCPSSCSQSAQHPVNHCTSRYYPNACPSGGTDMNFSSAPNGGGQGFGHGMCSAFAISAELDISEPASRPVDLPMCTAASMDQLLPNMGLSPSMAFPLETSFPADKAPSYALPLEMF